MRLNKIIQRDYTSFSLYYQIKLPLDLEISIPSDDPVRLVSAFVEEMDLSELYKTYGRIRKNQATPRQMLKLVIYAAMNRIYSSRDIRKACKRDINFMYLLEGMPAPELYKFNGQEFKMNVKSTETIDLEWGGKLVFVNSVVGGAIDTRFMPAILKGIMSRMEQGPLTGSYARDVRVIVYDGKMHPVDSNEISFMLAGRQAFSEAFKNAGPKILEPIYDVEVFVPSDKLGDVMSDMQGRRGMIMGMSSEKGYEKLAAKVPLKEMSNYSTALSSLTGGRASFIMKFASYELVPTDVQNKLMKEFEEQEKEEV